MADKDIFMRRAHNRLNILAVKHGMSINTLTSYRKEIRQSFNAFYSQGINYVEASARVIFSCEVGFFIF